MVVAGVVEAFGEAAFGGKLLFEAAEPAVQQVVGLANQADEGVGSNLGGAFFHRGPTGRIGDPADRQ